MSNKQISIFTICLVTLEWILFKVAYPYPDLMGDSYSYLTAAVLHRDINIWPIGYSKFLSLFHGITHSATALVSFQFFALEITLLYFYLQIKYYFQFRRDTAIILYGFLFCNPFCFYLSNLLASDSLFAVLSILWFSELLQIVIERPSFWKLWPQAFYIGVAFTFRYNAMYYPIVAALAMIMNRNRIVLKVVGSLLFIIFVVPFIVFSRNAGEKLTGVPIYSILSGWQMGNNAMEIRGEISVDSTKLPSHACKEVDKICEIYFREVGPDFKRYLDSYDRNYFIVGWQGPLKIYMLKTYGGGSLKDWALSGITFDEYGKFIVRNYPLAYIRYHVLPNVKFYFLPPLQDLEIYNMGSDSVSESMQRWFGYKSTRVSVISKTIQAKILSVFPINFLFLNILFPVLFLVYLVRRRKGLKELLRDRFGKACMLGGAYFLLNAVFSIIANRACLRYEYFSMILFLVYSTLLLDRIAVRTN